MVNSLQLLCLDAVSYVDDALVDGTLLAGSGPLLVRDPGNESLGAAAERAPGKVSESEARSFALLEGVANVESGFVWCLMFP